MNENSFEYFKITARLKSQNYLKWFQIILIIIICTYFIKSMEQALKNYSDGLEFIHQIEKNIQEININTPSEIISAILSKIIFRIKEDHLGLIVTLHSRNVLQKLLQGCYAKQQKDKNEEQQKMLSILYIIAFKSFLRFEPKYVKILAIYKIKGIQFDAKKDKQIIKETHIVRYLEAQNMMIQLYRIKPMDITFGKGKDINEFIHKYLICPITNTPLQEIMYTWVRRQVEFLQSEVWKQNSKNQKINLICCYLHFSAGSKQQFLQNIYQTVLVDNKSKQFDQNFYKDNKDLIKKHVVSFLNTDGGVVYIGFKFDQTNKIIETIGYPLSNDDKFKFLEVMIKQIAIKIYPCDEEDINQTVENQTARLLKQCDAIIASFKTVLKDNPDKAEFKLTKYITVQFVNIYNQGSYLFQKKKQETKLNKFYYIIKIKVKTGDPYEVYHYINEKQVPEAYFRERISYTKKSIFQYYDMLYDKLKKRANREEPNKIKKKDVGHYLCRNILTLQKPKLKQYQK